jgi:AcrR family transcriptional regulator
MSTAPALAVPAPTLLPKRRRDPVQERSHETVARIHAAASRLLADGVAPQALTTAQIAAAAGLSVGALYRFFPDKQAVVDAIALRHLESFQESLAATLMAAVPETPAAFLAAVIDAFAAYLEAHADFRTLAYGAPAAESHATGGRAISRTLFEQQAGAGDMAALMREFLALLFGIDTDEGFDFRLRIAAEIGDRLIGHAFAQPTISQRARVLAEAKQVLSAYLFAPPYLVSNL